MDVKDGIISMHEAPVNLCKIFVEAAPKIAILQGVNFCGQKSSEKLSTARKH